MDLSAAGETILSPSNNTISFPLGGDGENDFLGGGGGGNGGDGTGIGTGGTGNDVTGIGIGIGGDGGTGGNGAEFPVQINFVDSSGASAVTAADSSASSSDGSSESLDDFLAGILGSNGGSDVSDATGTAIGIGGDGGTGGNGAVLGATDFNINTADLSTTQSASLDGFLDSLLSSSSGDSTAVAGQAGSTVTDGTSVSIDGSGGAGGSAAEFLRSPYAGRPHRRPFRDRHTRRPPRGHRQLLGQQRHGFHQQRGRPGRSPWGQPSDLDDRPRQLVLTGRVPIQ